MFVSAFLQIFIQMFQQIWKSFGTIDLTEDKNILLSHFEPISDRIIGAALYLLKQRYPNVKGFKNILLTDISSLKQNESGFKFVDIINEDIDHLIVISNTLIRKQVKHSF